MSPMSKAPTSPPGPYPSRSMTTAVECARTSASRTGPTQGEATTGTNSAVWRTASSAAASTRSSCAPPGKAAGSRASGP
ncbi:hypothetical protein [Streptomyces sp. CS081A]|uniref:hypothetical protein n=1 Tax=Streptomyces sp. CS081A TaxID=2162709 RepID=UPI000D5158B1|nr:hypothetical protein [Streptomyces sp. CS081A]PVC74460.1 hypothetical protein DBP18_09670 [Streptomyces sp. CS081A]